MLLNRGIGSFKYKRMKWQRLAGHQKFCDTIAVSAFKRNVHNEKLSVRLMWFLYHYNDVIMSAIASQTTGLTIIYSTVCSAVDQRKHQSSAPLAFVRGIPRGHKRLSKELRRQWFKTPWRPLWRHCDEHQNCWLMYCQLFILPLSKNTLFVGSFREKMYVSLIDDNRRYLCLFWVIDMVQVDKMFNVMYIYIYTYII